MSPFKSLAKILGATAAVGVLGAASLAPVAGIGGTALARTTETMASNLADMSHGDTPGVTTITDSTGDPIAWLYDQRRYEVAPDQIPQSMKDAIVSIEDRRFYDHSGVDLQGFGRAMVTNVLAGGVQQGASTLDQQYIKNYLLLVDAQSDDERSAAIEQSIPRKLREMKMAADLEKNLTKDEILARYLNLVPFGNQSFGVEAAAQTYFGIPASQLQVHQSAMLAGMVQSSEALNPYTNPEGAMERRNTVLDAMVSTGTLDPAEAETAKQQPLGVLDTPNTIPNGCITAADRGFFCDYALTYLDSKGISTEELKRGAYTIQTTLDPQVQAAAHETVTGQVDPKSEGVAGVLNVVKPGKDTHDILAMTSSRDYGLNQDDHETILPQPTSLVGSGAGSVFKIFAAAVAIENGMGLDTMLDVPNRYEATGMGSGGADGCPAGTYCVENSGAYRPKMPLKDALAYSPNTTFVKMIEDVGVPAVVDMSVKLGLRSYDVDKSFDEDHSISDYFKKANLGSFVLGPTAVNPLELSNVGATLASDGRWCEPNPIAKVTDRNGKEVKLDRPKCENVLNPDVAHALSAGLTGDAVEGTASESAHSYGWNQPVAAKTGTTESHQSAAFLGFNSGFAAAPYIFNDGTNVSPLCTSPVMQCPQGGLFGGFEPARMWFGTAGQLPQATSGTVPTADEQYRDGTLSAKVGEVEGLNENQARRQIESRGYKVNVVRESGTGRPRGEVLRTSAPGNGVLSPGGTVNLHVSDGSAPPLPDFGDDRGTVPRRDDDSGSDRDSDSRREDERGDRPGAPSAPTAEDFAAQLRAAFGL